MGSRSRVVLRGFVRRISAHLGLFSGIASEQEGVRMKILGKILRYFYNSYFRHDSLIELIERGLVIGENVSIQEDAIIDPDHCWLIKLGDNVTIAQRVHILAHDASSKMHLGYTRIGKVEIGNKVFIGAGSIILPGTTIGNEVIIGAGSIVRNNIPDHVVAAGNPCRILCSLYEFIRLRKEELHTFPCFGNEYTIENGVTKEMKLKMNEQITRVGYIV
jgi:maltose O-acetyltransferase